MERLTDFDRRKNIQEACDIWNKLKDKTKIVDIIINLKNEITGLTIDNQVLENALELKIINDAISEGWTLTDKEVKESKEFFIEQAKKELKGE